MLFGRRETISKLDDVLNSSWKLLHKGVGNFRHPFYRPVLTTMNGNQPEVRTVILRGFSEKDNTLICHSDARAPKVSQIQDNPDVSWLFYHPKKWLQLRLSGTASIHTNDKIAESQWKNVRWASRMSYSAKFPPGTPAGKPTSGLPDFSLDKKSEVFRSPEARRNFSAIVCRFDQMDWLMLKLTGHLRAKFLWKGNHVDASWVIP